MTITYEFGKSLYVNTTNRCSNECGFCLRNNNKGVGSADSLWLEREPSREEILEAIQNHDLTGYDELVFCGFGEPTYRLKDILWVCNFVKAKNDIKTRLDTNGHGSLINNTDTAAMLTERIDSVSISLNAPNAEKYAMLCRPVYGLDAFDAVVDFTKKAVRHIGNVTLTVVEGLPEEDIAACRRLAGELHCDFRVRSMIE